MVPCHSQTEVDLHTKRTSHTEFYTSPITIAMLHPTSLQPVAVLGFFTKMAGASIFAFLLSNNDPLTCIKLSCVISLCVLPLLIFLVGEMNRLADSIFDHSENASSDVVATTFSIGKAVTVEEAIAITRQGWREYMNQPVLLVSLAYVLVCFNVTLAPDALMNTFLIHQAIVNPCIFFILHEFDRNGVVMRRKVNLYRIDKDAHQFFCHSLSLSSASSPSSSKNSGYGYADEVLRGLGNLIAGDGYMVDSVLIVGNIITDMLCSACQAEKQVGASHTAKNIMM
ncbi:hypothetical protein ABZP36_013141 [Zizania latifolia]